MSNDARPERQVKQAPTLGSPAQEARRGTYGPTTGQRVRLGIGCAISSAVSLIACGLLLLGVRALYVLYTVGSDAAPAYFVILIVISLVLLLVGIRALVACVRGLLG